MLSNRIDYKLKVMHDEHDEYDALNFSSMRQNVNAYSREENNLSNDYSMLIPDDVILWYYHRW